MLLLVLLATVGAWLGFANPLFHFPLVSLAFPLGLAWIGLRATSGKKAFKFGWLAGLTACTGLYYWMVIPVQTYGGLPWFVALPCPVLLAAFMGLYYGLFSLAMYYAGRQLSGIILCLLAGFAWATMEMAMGAVLSGFPWTNLASAFAPWPFAIQGASVVGAYGLSGILATLSVAILLCNTYRSAIWLTAGLLIGITAFGFYRGMTLSVGNQDYMITIAQGNVDQGLKWLPAYQKDTVKKYVKISLEAIEKHKPKIVIWPETAMPFYLQDNTPYRKAIEILARDSETNIITGSPAYRITDMKKNQYVLFNRAWLMDDTGRTTQYYDKEHLVPFGEYMPMEQWMPFEKLVQAAGNFISGTENKPLMLRGVALGMLICYEAIFPELAQKQVERGASALLNISNDAWFGNTSAPRQHLNLSIMRAVEQGRWLVRGTNTGISAFVDPVGRIVAVSNQFKAESLSVKISPLMETTVFHRNYDWLRQTIFLLTFIGFAWVAYEARKKK